MEGERQAEPVQERTTPRPRTKLLDAIEAALKESPSREEGQAAAVRMAGALRERFGHGFLEMALTAGAEDDDPFVRGLVQASMLPESLANERLWFSVYPGSVGYLIGETGVGKSTLLYGMAMQAALNQPYFDIEYGLGRQLNVLYIDPENAGNEENGGNCRLKLDKMGYDWRPPNLVFSDGMGLDLSRPKHMATLTRLITEPQHYIKGWDRGPFDLAILDPLANVYAVTDENSNAEAAARVKALKALSAHTGVSSLLVHHDSPKTGSGMSYGRGATATLAGVDTAFVIRSREPQDDVNDDYRSREGVQRTGLIRWQNTKNRLGGKGSIFLKMLGGDRFQRVGFEDWQGAEPRGGAPDNPMPRIKEAIKTFLTDGRWYGTDSIAAFVVEDTGAPQSAARAGIKILLDEGEIRAIKDGRGTKYRLAGFEDNDADARRSSFPVSRPAPRPAPPPLRSDSLYDGFDDDFQAPSSDPRRGL